MKTKNILCGPAIVVVLHFGVLAASAQTYIYTYTGSDFTSIFNAPSPGFFIGGSYTTSSKITGFITFSAPLGDNYEGNPSATLLSYNFSDGVGPQNVAGSTLGWGLGFPNVMASTFGTDSSGNIVSWNFEVVAFLSFFSPPETKGIQTENDSGNVMDSGNIDTPFGFTGDGSVTSDPGVWVETVVPEPSAGSLFVSFAALTIGIRAVQGRFKMKSQKILCGVAIAVVLQLGTLAGSAQTNIYLFSGTETNITLPPGTYIITAYGAPGGGGLYGSGGLGAEMSGEFNFSTSMTFILLVGGGASSFDVGYYDYYDYGGGGGSFVVNGSTPLVIAGGGGGGYEYGSPGSVSTNGNRGNLPGPGAGGGGGGGGFLRNGGDGDNGFSLGYGIIITNCGGGGFSFQNGGGGGIASSYYGIANYYGGGNGGYGGGGSGGGYSGIPNMGYFSEPGGGGGGGGYEGGHGGYAPDGGNGGGSIIDSSAIAILTEVSGVASPDDPANGEIIITAIPTPLLITISAAFGFTNGLFGFNVIGPSGSNMVIQASTDLKMWMPLQTNLLGSGPLYFSDPQSTTNVQRFYRAQLSP